LGDVSYAATIPRIIPLTIAWPPTISVNLLATYSNKHPLVNNKTSQESFIALPGMAYLVASRAHACEANIGVLSVAPSLTMLNNAPSSHNLFIINTPFIPKEWHKLLLNTASFNKFYDLSNCICFSFNMGVTSPSSFTYTPPNHSLALFYPTHVLSHIHNKLHNCYYTGPFSCSHPEFSIGLFHTSLTSWYYSKSQFFDRMKSHSRSFIPQK
jgi:hypothetical protein